MSAAVRASNAAGSKAPAPGLNNTSAPDKATPAANHRMGPTLSPNIGIAKIIPNTGFRKLMAVASDTGISATAANIKLTPTQPSKERRKCKRKDGRVNFGRVLVTNSNRAKKAKKNLPAETCKGCKLSPVEVFCPNVFAIIIVPAINTVANNIMPADLNRFEFSFISKIWCPTRLHEINSDLWDKSDTWSWVQKKG